MRPTRRKLVAVPEKDDMLGDSMTEDNMLENDGREETNILEEKSPLAKSDRQEENGSSEENSTPDNIAHQHQLCGFTSLTKILNL